MIAALYVDELGPYPLMAGVDAWSLPRDARTYAGPYSVVAHPPCTNYGALRHLALVNDADCGPIAVQQVRAFGGVLEHPAHSKLWERCCLPLPGALTDAFGGYTLFVEQVAWGHVARKRTWLYFVRIDAAFVLRTMRMGGKPTHWVSGGGTGRGRTPPGIKVCSAQQRRRSPVAFAEWLVDCAGKVNR